MQLLKLVKLGADKGWNTLFPPRCLGCGGEGEWVCSLCWDNLELIKTPICYRCRRLSPDFQLCRACRQHQRLERVVVCGYWGGLLQKLVYGLKYDRARVIAGKMGRLLSCQLGKLSLPESVLITAVPLHRRKLGNRGFNHAQILAEIVARDVHRPYEQLLRRVRWTQPQFGLTKKERQENVAEAFRVVPQKLSALSGKTVILVDDIITTGATLNSCAKVLRQNGAKAVWGLVLAKV